MSTTAVMRWCRCSCGWSVPVRAVLVRRETTVMWTRMGIKSVESLGQGVGRGEGAGCMLFVVAGDAWEGAVFMALRSAFWGFCWSD